MRFVRWVATGCFLGVVCAAELAPAQEAPADALAERRALDHATRLEQAGRQDEAMRVLEDLLDEQHRSVSGLVLLSQIANRAGEPERALSRAEAAVISDSLDLPALRQIWIRTLQAAGLPDSAVSEARRWIGENPTEASAYLELSGLWARAGDPDRAADALLAGRAALGTHRLFVQELAALQADQGRYAEAAVEWRAMLAWGDPGVEAVARRIREPASVRQAALAALRIELAGPETTVLERKGGLNLALRLAEYTWAREIVAHLAEYLPEPAALEVLRGYVARAREVGDRAGAAWAAESLVERVDSEEETLYWMAVAADLAYEAGDSERAEASFSRLISEAKPGSDLYEMSLRRLFELLAGQDPARAEDLLMTHVALYPEQSRASVEMSVRLARAWLRRGRLERARDAIALVPARDLEEAATQAAVRGRIEILAGRPTAARAHLELAAGVSAGRPGGRIEALEMLTLVEDADSASLAALGRGIVTASQAGDPGPLLESVSDWSAERTPGGASLGSFAAEALDAVGKEEEARTVRISIVEGWPGSPEAARALLDLGRIDRSENPGQAVAWLERLIIEYPESALAPIARRLLVEIQTGVKGA